MAQQPQPPAAPGSPPSRTSTLKTVGVVLGGLAPVAQFLGFYTQNGLVITVASGAVLLAVVLVVSAWQRGGRSTAVLLVATFVMVSAGGGAIGYSVARTGYTHAPTSSGGNGDNFDTTSQTSDSFPDDTTTDTTTSAADSPCGCAENALAQKISGSELPSSDCAPAHQDEYGTTTAAFSCELTLSAGGQLHVLIQQFTSGQAADNWFTSFDFVSSGGVCPQFHLVGFWSADGGATLGRLACVPANGNWAMYWTYYASAVGALAWVTGSADDASSVYSWWYYDRNTLISSS